MSGWQNEEDIRRDLFEYSNVDYVKNDTFASAPPTSIAEYRARTSKGRNPGLFDDHDPDVTIFISGRGKFRHRIITPGQPAQSFPEDDIEIQKKIRQVSGLGYRNEIIEKEFCSWPDMNKDVDEAKDSIIPDVKLRSVSKCPELASTSLAPDLQKLNISEMSYPSTECSSETESENLSILSEKSNLNKNNQISKNLKLTESIESNNKMLWEQFQSKNQNINVSTVDNKLDAKYKSNLTTEIENQSTKESSQTESITSYVRNTKSKKKKKFKSFLPDDCSSTVENIFGNHIFNASEPAWAPLQYGAKNINVEEFPLLK